MKVGGSRSKGSSFERLVAKKILATFPGFDDTDCHRTPLSGGHPFGSPTDLVLSERLLSVFPFVVECKHRKSWNAGHLFAPTASMLHWLLKTEDAALKVSLKRDHSSMCPKQVFPLVVMRGHGTDIFCAVLDRAVRMLALPVADCGVVRLAAVGCGPFHPRVFWYAYQLENFLQRFVGQRSR